MMTRDRLEWDYNRAGTEESANYRGFTIRAVRDDHAENPFAAWDCEPPTCVYSGRDFTDYSDGETLDPFATMTDSRVARRWREIAAALDLKPDDVAREIRERRADYGATAAETRRELFSETLADMKPGRGYSHAGDYMTALAALWNIAGVVAVDWTSTGCSQGDYADGLTVATPAWAKKVGAPKASHKRQCEAAGKLWGAWAWGDVYGYVIRNADGDDLDSCWGFYGDDHSESGLADAARDAVDSIIERTAKARQRKAVELIRARVPLHVRPAILENAARAAEAAMF